MQEPRTMEEMMEKARELKERTGALFLAHYYQRREIQMLADFIGDSLGLSRKAAEAQAPLILFCGVHFMAETASLLCPGSKVLVPDLAAGCPMADMVDAAKLEAFKSLHPGAPVVCYVNTTAEVKAHSDWCCTSANAAEVVSRVPADEVIFVPDRHLGEFAARKSGRTVHLYPGWCPTHRRLKSSHIEEMRRRYPGAAVMAHPECEREVLELCDYVGSTGGMLRYAKASDAAEIIVGTEEGILFELERQNPAKTFILAARELVCPNMKLNTLQKIIRTLEGLENEVRVPDHLRAAATLPIQRMLDIG